MASLGPLIPDQGPASVRVWRRVRGITIEVVVLALVVVLSPLLLVVAVAVDAALWARRRKPLMAVRLLAMLVWFLVGELYGLLGLLAIRVTSGGHDSAARRERVYRLKRRWLASHLAGATRLFGLRFEIEGLELAGPGPIVVLIRHTSIIDNVLPDAIIGRAHGIGFRFVIKRELQMVPTIDIGGRWVPTLFVRRASGDTDAELERLRMLTLDMASRDGVLIYPEGTRSTPAKLARAKAVIAERQPAIAHLADRLQNLLPPRLGGSIALLESARGCRRGDLRPCRLGRIRAFQRHLVGWSRRDDRAASVLALPRRRGAFRSRCAGGVVVRLLAGARRLGRPRA